MSWQEGNIARMQSIRDLIALKQQRRKQGFENIMGAANTVIGLASKERENQFKAEEAEKARKGEIGKIEKQVELQEPYTPTWEQQTDERQAARDASMAELEKELASRKSLTLLELGATDVDKQNNLAKQIDEFFNTIETRFPQIVSTTDENGQAVLDWAKAINDPSISERLRAAFQSRVMNLSPRDQELAMKMYDDQMAIMAKMPGAGKTDKTGQDKVDDSQRLAKINDTINRLSGQESKTEKASGTPTPSSTIPKGGIVNQWGQFEADLEKNIKTLLGSSAKIKPDDIDALNYALSESSKVGRLSPENYDRFYRLVQALRRMYGIQ